MESNGFFPLYGWLGWMNEEINFKRYSIPDYRQQKRTGRLFKSSLDSVYASHRLTHV